MRRIQCESFQIQLFSIVNNIPIISYSPLYNPYSLTGMTVRSPVLPRTPQRMITDLSSEDIPPLSEQVNHFFMLRWQRNYLLGAGPK